MERTHRGVQGCYGPAKGRLAVSEELHDGSDPGLGRKRGHVAIGITRVCLPPRISGSNGPIAIVPPAVAREALRFSLQRGVSDREETL